FVIYTKLLTLPNSAVPLYLFSDIETILNNIYSTNIIVIRKLIKLPKSLIPNFEKISIGAMTAKIIM
ncbi:hypothetical protein, partial [Mesobacillus zeae]|uniref:hypothetical protein n=1 Tax=Mesobacillus zeae TaxID=1917180 RepID=UPI001C7164D3